MKSKIRSMLAGAACGMINGLFGAGGGMVLVPLLGNHTDITPDAVFSSSLAIILPICAVSLVIRTGGSLPWNAAWPYLLGSVAGGLAAGFLGRRIPTVWLHRLLGILILYGGFRYLC